MTPIPRRVGWAMMALALAIGWGARGAGWTHYGPLPAVAVALLVGGIGVMLVVTDMMVRGLYAELDKAKASEAAGVLAAPVRGDAEDIAVGGDMDRA